MKEFSKEDYKMYLKEYKERGASCFKRSRNKSLGKEETAKAYREHLGCQAMIRNMNYIAYQNIITVSDPKFIPSEQNSSGIYSTSLA